MKPYEVLRVNGLTIVCGKVPQDDLLALLASIVSPDEVLLSFQLARKLGAAYAWGASADVAKALSSPIPPCMMCPSP